MAPLYASPASERYLAAASTLLDDLAGQLPAIEAAAQVLADTIHAGRLVYVTGTGHSHMIAEEAFYRAGGLAAVYPILEPSLLLGHGAVKSTLMERLHDLGRVVIEDAGVARGDVLIVASNSGRNAAPVDMALQAKELGATVIAITSRAHSAAVDSRHRSGHKLMDVADHVIDTLVEYGDATLTVPGVETPMGPLSTVAGVCIINALTVRTAELLAAQGTVPDVFVSANAASSGDPAVLERARARIKPL